ncbi:hypothetical protein [Clostridium novyi]|nr:hypothetical protein [Clostridium novyi]
MIEKMEIEAIKNLLIKKGIITEKEIKDEYDSILRKRWEDNEDGRFRHTY